MKKALENKRILLVISGGIAAYKSLELIRLIRKSGGAVRCILTEGGGRFVTPLSVASLSEEQVYTDLWSLKDETEMGHIRLSREADLIVVAPASASIMAKMAWGLTDDLASTTLLAANKPILLAPAMNHVMWNNPATQDNMDKLRIRGFLEVGPTEGDMACGEYGMGRMADPQDILKAIVKALSAKPAMQPKTQKKSNLEYLNATLADESYAPLEGFTALVTSGPTYEPIDPVRFIGNRSSGRQGIAIAKALSEAGAKVTLVTGPVSSNELSSILPCHPREGGDPAHSKNRMPAQGGHDKITAIKVQTAAEMLKACEKSLPADIAICAAAVADWAPEKPQAHKIKKRGDQSAPAIKLKENPDILKTLSAHKKRPQLVIGFAAETENLLKNAKEKLARKGCDWILANDVSDGVFGEDETHIHLVTRKYSEDWKKQSKQAVAKSLTDKIIRHFHRNQKDRMAAK
jgi:phosphopantothenoylcysteine decarboxylase / phosphopantothenate---cysteine ligase